MSDNPLTTGKAATVKRSKQELVDLCNATRSRLDIEWRISKVGQIYISLTDDQPVYVSPDVMNRRGERMSWEDTAKLNERLEGLGANARYRPDGSRYFLDQAA